jgi:GNAT superfamily N-acetyltransferase
VSGTNRFNKRGEAIFAASAAGALIGVCGLNVDPYASDPRVGRVRHLYVLSGFRQLGVGRQLVEASKRRVVRRQNSMRRWGFSDKATCRIARMFA